eukprot:jgi/Chrzof1/12198/Cz06g25010.t1
MALEVMRGTSFALYSQFGDRFGGRFHCGCESLKHLAGNAREPSEAFQLLPALSDEMSDPIPCFASELEKEVAELEEEARRDCDFDFNFGLNDDTYKSTATCQWLGDDTVSLDQRDSSSEHSGVLPSLLPEVVDAIRANAELVISTGETLKPGAWKGCSKSAECDREDRHRGLCNHRATIPGPMAVAYASQQLPVDSLTDSFTEQQDEVDKDDTDSVHAETSMEESLSGGHSYNQRPKLEDEREVASALKAVTVDDLLPAERDQLPFRPTARPALPADRCRVEPIWIQSGNSLSSDQDQYDVSPVYSMDQGAPAPLLTVTVPSIHHQPLGSGSSGSPAASMAALQIAPIDFRPLPREQMVNNSLSLPPSSPTAAATSSLPAPMLRPVKPLHLDVHPDVFNMPKLPRVLNKSSKPVSKPSLDGAGSPRGKKRTAGRIAANPNGHCCTQCGTQSTPVWRAGPHGPKTLCNACGVRYMKVAKKK